MTRSSRLEIEPLWLEASREYTAGQYQRAERLYRKITELAPDFIGAQLYLGHSLFYQKRFRDAIRHYEAARALQLATTEQSRDTVRLLTDQLGMAYGLAGDVATARIIFEDAIAADPSYAMYYYNLACAHAGLGDIEQMLNNLRLAFEHRHDISPAGKLPNPEADGSFRPYLSDKRFRKLLAELAIW